MSWDDLRGRGVIAGVNRYDTARFGIRTARVVVRQDEGDVIGAAAEIASHLSRIDPEVAIIRWPAALVELGQVVAGAGWRIHPADTLVYWSVPVRRGRAPEGDLTSPADQPGLAVRLPGLVRDVFANYPNHYLASTQFDPRAVLDGYVEWATRTAEESPARCFLLVRGGEVVSFATTVLLTDGSLEVELAGTAAHQRNSGHYRALMHGLLGEAAAIGAPRLLISTQAGNTAVQSAWASLGLRPLSAFTTVHAWPIDARDG